MMTIRISGSFGALAGRTRKQRDAFRKLPKEFEAVVKKETPIDTGNARKKTFLASNVGTTAKVRAGYPYAKRLNEGWSKQAPKGFVKPSLEWLRKRIKQIMKMR